MKKIIAFNWKMYPESLEKTKGILSVIENRLFSNISLKKFNFIICPPSLYFFEFDSISKIVDLGSQNIFWENPVGAYTGEISATMIKKMGVKYVIIGHSERRKYLDETDEMINKKVLTALKAGLKVILCVGEQNRATGDKRQATSKSQQYIRKQLETDLRGLTKKLTKLKANSLIIAYEPIWAIGTGKTCNVDIAVDIAKFIKQHLHISCNMSHVSILYGGSVNSKNISNFIDQSEIDGVLVGGASVDKKELKNLLQKLSK